MSPVCTIITAAMTDIILSSNGRRPTRSMRSQGMKLAIKNQVWRKPDMSADKCAEKFKDVENKVLE